ncbi:MAG: FimB/Mfa2 family fimbrial subunit [Alistipes sp.]|jgi:hypothetical protein|nr:FimB/Mfa2 family fimbrial subunit [Alistipes sp.]
MKKKIFCLLSALALLLSGCVKEHLPVCYSGLYLRYNYTLNPLDENVFGPDINELTVHVFDSRGVFFEEYVFDTPGENSLVYLPLPDGEWSIVTWGSEEKSALSRSYDMGTVATASGRPVYNSGITRGGTNLEEARLWIKNIGGAESDGRSLVSDRMSRLYHASLYDIVTVTSTSEVEVIDVPMMQNTNTLRIVVNGLAPSATRATIDQYDVAADMANGHYRHDNRLCDEALQLRYQNGGWENGAEGLQYDLTVLRPFIDDDDSELTLTIPGLSSFGYESDRISIPIIESILDSPGYNTQRDLDRANLYIFEFVFDTTDVSLNIFINGWEVVYVDPIVS